jgi:hypothetical protein
MEAFCHGHARWKLAQWSKTTKACGQQCPADPVLSKELPCLRKSGAAGTLPKKNHL